MRRLAGVLTIGVASFVVFELLHTLFWSFLFWDRPYPFVLKLTVGVSGVFLLAVVLYQHFTREELSSEMKEINKVCPQCGAPVDTDGKYSIHQSRVDTKVYRGEFAANKILAYIVGVVFLPAMIYYVLGQNLDLYTIPRDMFIATTAVFVAGSLIYGTVWWQRKASWSKVPGVICYLGACFFAFICLGTILWM